MLEAGWFAQSLDNHKYNQIEDYTCSIYSLNGNLPLTNSHFCTLGITVFNDSHQEEEPDSSESLFLQKKSSNSYHHEQALGSLIHVQENCPICLDTLDRDPFFNPNAALSRESSASKEQQQQHNIELHGSPAHEETKQPHAGDSPQTQLSRENSTAVGEGAQKGSFILVILCGHFFHWRCLDNWHDTTCPLCRYH